MDSSDPDARYASGEITREEWARLQRTQAIRARPGRPSRRGLLVALVMVAFGLTLAGGFLWSLAHSASAPWAPSFSTASRIPAADLAALNASATPGVGYAANDSLWFAGGSVDLVAYLSPADHDMAFVLQGMANPAIHMSAGTRVKLTVVNMDPGEYHGWALSRTGPPYSSMPMMGSGSMMGTGSMMSMPMLSPASGGMYATQALSFTAQAGSYWYLCPAAGHAAAGMYGEFIVA